MARAITIGFSAIVRSISGVSVSAFETPRNTSASCSASASVVMRRVVANSRFIGLMSSR